METSDWDEWYHRVTLSFCVWLSAMPLFILDSQTMTHIISFISSFLTHTPFFSHTGEFLDIDLLSSEVTSVLRGRRWTVRPLLWVYCLLAKHTNTHTQNHTHKANSQPYSCKREGLQADAHICWSGLCCAKASSKHITPRATQSWL